MYMGTYEGIDSVDRILFVTVKINNPSSNGIVCHLEGGGERQGWRRVGEEKRERERGDGMLHVYHCKQHP